MAYERKFHPKLNFVLTHCSGTMDDDSLLLQIMSMRVETTGYSHIRALVDMRDLRNVDKLTVKGLIRISETHKALFPKMDFLSAVLAHPSQSAKMVDVYAHLVKSAQLRVRVFQGYIDEPLAWLGYSKDAIRKLKRFIAKNPPRGKRKPSDCPCDFHVF